MVGRWSRELGRPSPAPASASREEAVRITAHTGSRTDAGWASDGVVVPVMGGTTQPPGGKGPCRITRLGKERRSRTAGKMANASNDKTDELRDKLYRAAKQSPQRRFHALSDKVYRRDFLERSWNEVKANKGAPGVDGVTIQDIEEQGADVFLDALAVELKDGTYRPLPVRRVTIPKRNGGGKRHLGIPAVRDRVVQTAVKLVLEPIFEADFLDCSFGFRPKRSAHDALEVIRTEVNRGRVWVVDADIAGFFDAIDRGVLRSALEERISDGAIVKLILGWLRAGVLAGNALIHPETGTPQGGVISPLLANVVLHRLDREWEAHHTRLGVMVRYADDLVILCPTKERAQASLAALTAILAGLGLSLGSAKTRLVDMREGGTGFDFLGFHHRRVESFSRKGRYHCARWPSRRAVRDAKQAIRALTDKRRRLLPVGVVVKDVNRFLVGWRNYFRWGNSTYVFYDLDRFVEVRLAGLISKRHRRGHTFGFQVLRRNQSLWPVRLVGSVRYRTANATR
jgi:RNA-directed DNA polymerase